MARRPFGYRDAIAVIQILAFTIFLGFGVLIICFRKSGWLALNTFSLVRLLGAACLLATFERDSSDVWAGVMICESLCIAFLTVLLKGQLARLNRFVGVIGNWGFVLPELFSLAGVGITTAGFVYAWKGVDPLAPNPIVQTAVALFGAMYLYTVGLFVRLWLERHRVPPEEKVGLLSFGVCIPFMVARIVYSFIYVVTGDPRFNAVQGDPTIYLILVAANEIGMVAGWCSTVMRLRSMPSREALEMLRDEVAPQQVEGLAELQSANSDRGLPPAKIRTRG